MIEKNNQVNIKLLAIICVTFLCLIMMLTPMSAYGANINVIFKGEQVGFTDAYPFVDENNRTQMPLRALSEAMAYGVEWDSYEKSVCVFEVKDSKTATCLKFVIGSDIVETTTIKGSNFKTTDTLDDLLLKTTRFSDTTQTQMDTSAIIKSSRTYIPVRYVAELFSYKVDWEQATRTVIIE